MDPVDDKNPLEDRLKGLESKFDSIAGEFARFPEQIVGGMREIFTKEEPETKKPEFNSDELFEKIILGGSEAVETTKQLLDSIDTRVEDSIKKVRERELTDKQKADQEAILKGQEEANKKTVGRLFSRYPDLTKEDSPLVQEANRVMEEEGIPATVAGLVEAAELAAERLNVKPKLNKTRIPRPGSTSGFDMPKEDKLEVGEQDRFFMRKFGVPTAKEKEYLGHKDISLRMEDDKRREAHEKAFGKGGGY